MRESGFSLTRILPYKDRIGDSILIRENKGQRKPAFSHVLRRAKVQENSSPDCLGSNLVPLVEIKLEPLILKGFFEKSI